jgi:hypothetical protein
MTTESFGPQVIFFMFVFHFLFQLTYIFIPYYATGGRRDTEGALNHDDGRHHRHVSTPNHRREQLLAGWKLDATGQPGGNEHNGDDDKTGTTRRRDDETTGRWDDETTGRWDDETTGRWDDETTGRWDDETTGRRDDETTRRRDNKTTRRRDDETTGRRDDETTGRRDDETTGRRTKRAQTTVESFGPQVIFFIFVSLFFSTYGSLFTGFIYVTTVLQAWQPPQHPPHTAASPCSQGGSRVLDDEPGDSNDKSQAGRQGTTGMRGGGRGDEGTTNGDRNQDHDRTTAGRGGHPAPNDSHRPPLACARGGGDFFF